MSPVLTLPDGRSLGYETSGDPDGLPVFALHGTPGCRLNRHPDGEAVAATGAWVITYDRPGYGLSTRAPGRRVADCVGDVAALADHLGIDRFAVFGGSGGGPHCLAVAAGLPQRVLRVRCIVGVAPWGVEGLDWFEGMDPANVEEFGVALEGEAVLTAWLEREAAAMLERVAADPANVLGDFELSDADRAVLADARLADLIRESTAEEVRQGVGGWADDDLAFCAPWGFDLASITAPAEVWYGETDVLVPPGHGRWLAAHVPGAVVRVQHDEGHMTGLDEVIEDLRSLVASVRG